ncbi:MAG: methyltransferase domain-containing protein [Candidatus Beckwithbacteria bacterium]|nr:methyltransferase domain-containing protein [Candidatus Beckwithbacteria bacterium]
MADKVFVPKTSATQWDSYWQKTNYQREMELCQSDGLLPIFRKYLTKKPAIIEAGCCAGKWIIYFGKRGYNIVGVDNNLLALKKLTGYYPAARIKLGDVRQLPFKPNSFAVYLSLGVVEHFIDGPQAVLVAAFRVLKPGGLAIVEVPFDNLIRRSRRWLRFIKPRKPAKFAREFYEYHYTKDELKKFMTQAGFVEAKFFPKDDLNPQKSIGLWLDWPGLRQEINNPDFRLTIFGQRLKRFYNLFHLNWLYSACVVCVARKPK